MGNIIENSKKGLKTVPLMVWLGSVVIASLLTCADYCLQNVPYPLMDDVELVQWVNFLSDHFGHKEEDPFDDSVCFINVGMDKQLVDVVEPAQDEWTGTTVYDTVGNAVITDRSKLLELLRIAEGSDYRYIFLDVRFEKGLTTPQDSALFATIRSMRNIVVASHHADDYEIADTALLAKTAIADYRGSFQAGFTRYGFLQEDEPSVALRMYSDLCGHDITRKGLLYTDNGRLCYNLSFIPIPACYSVNNQNSDLREDWGVVSNAGYSRLGSELLRYNSPEELRESFAGKILVIGDFERDVHVTYVGEVPGSILSLLAWRYLSEGRHKVSLGYYIGLFVLFFLMALFHLRGWTIDYLLCKIWDLPWGARLMLQLLTLSLLLFGIKVFLFCTFGKTILMTIPLLLMGALGLIGAGRQLKEEQEENKKNGPDNAGPSTASSPRPKTAKAAKCILPALLLLLPLTSEAAKYKVLRVKPGSSITIGNSRAATNLVFDETAKISWGSRDDAFEAMNTSNFKKYYFSARQFSSSGSFFNSVGQFLLRTNKTSTRGGQDAQMVVQRAKSGRVNQTRIALVVGNGAYTSMPSLLNPGRDVAAVSSKLLTLGFDVVECYDLDRSEMLALIDEFKKQANSYDAVMIYYAGHGICINNVNYLVPVFTPRGTNLTADMLVPCDALVSALKTVGCPVRMLWLDACRSNSGSGSAETGLAHMDIGNDMVVVFSAEQGHVAYDEGETGAANSPFAAALLSQMDRAGQDLSDLIRGVSEQVSRTTASRQRPTMSGIPPRFMFRPAAATAPSPGASSSGTSASVRSGSSAGSSSTSGSSNGTAGSEYVAQGIKQYRAMKYNEALASFRKAAQMGNTEANLQLGLLYIDSNFSGADAEQAESYFRQAASQGSAEAMYQLGLLFQGRDNAAAKQWFRKASAAGHAKAAQRLERMR